MKKIFLIFLLSSLLSLTGCGIVEFVNELGGNNSISDVVITETEWCDIEWDQLEFLIDLEEDVLEEIKPIETREDAIAVGTKIIKKIQQKGRYPGYELVSVCHYTEDNVWLFEYAVNANIKNAIDNGGLLIAVNGTEGRLIKAWCTEN